MFLCLCLLVSSQAPQSNLDIQEDVQVAPTQVGETQENEKEDLSSVISLISSLAAPTNTPVLPVIQFSPYYACCPMSMWSIELLIQSILFHQNIYTQKDLLHASWIFDQLCWCDVSLDRWLKRSFTGLQGPQCSPPHYPLVPVRHTPSPHSSLGLSQLSCVLPCPLTLPLTPSPGESQVPSANWPSSSCGQSSGT